MRFLSNLLSSALGTLLALGVLLLIGFLFLLALASSADRTPSVQAGSVLVATLDGPVPEAAADDPISQALGEGPRFDLRSFKQALRKAAADDRIDALRLNVRGGVQAQWATLEEMRRALLAFKESGKPIYASSADHGYGERDYFLATAADSLFAQPQAPFELNGFVLTSQFFRGTLNKLDIEPRIFRAGKYKSAVEPFTRDDLSPENREQLSTILDTQNSIFMDAIAQSRGLRTDTLEQLAEEDAVLNAEGAADARLIDGLRYHDEVNSLLNNRLGYDDEDAPTTSLASYTRVPASETGLERGGEGEIAVVYAVGAITSGTSGPSTNPLLGNETVGAETFREAMTEARESEAVKAVVLRVNSPGGLVPPSEAMRREVALTKRHKPVLVSMGDLAASGGYWISAPADTIVANPLTLTGSIGVFGVSFNTRDFFNNKLGITFDAVQTSPLADLQSTVGELSEKERQLLQHSVDDIYEAFLQNVAQGRNLTPAAVDSVAQGRVWTGQQAQTHDLVDVLGGLGTATELAAARAGLAPDRYRVRTLPRPKTFLQRFAESLETRAQAAWRTLATDTANRLLRRQTRLLQVFNEWTGTVQARLPVTFQIQ